jgi:exosortase/archaeosortase family protein
MHFYRKQSDQVMISNDIAVSGEGSHHVRWLPGLRFLAMAALIGLPLYVAAYFPHGEGSPLRSWLHAYLEWTARCAASIASPIVGPLPAHGDVIGGPYPLQIVLDCGAVDVLIIYVAAVIAFPASARERLVGVCFGCGVIVTANLLRIAALSWIGIHAPSRFSLWHEEILQLALLFLTLATFAIWRRRTNGERYE